MAEGRRLRNPNLLSDADQVRILDRVPIRLEDLRVETRVSVISLRDLRESLSFLHLVPLRGVPGTGCWRTRSTGLLVWHRTPPPVEIRLRRPPSDRVSRRTNRASRAKSTHSPSSGTHSMDRCRARKLPFRETCPKALGWLG